MILEINGVNYVFGDKNKMYFLAAYSLSFEMAIEIGLSFRSKVSLFFLNKPKSTAVFLTNLLFFAVLLFKNLVSDRALSSADSTMAIGWDIAG